MAGIPTGIVGKTGLLGLVGDFFRSERHFILLDEIGLTRVRRSLLLKEALWIAGFSWKFIDFNLVQFENSDRLRGLFCLYCAYLNFLSIIGLPSELSTGP